MSDAESKVCNYMYKSNRYLVQVTEIGSKICLNTILENEYSIYGELQNIKAKV